MKPIWIQDFTVNAYDADFMFKMKLSSFFNYFQEAAGLHADDLGAGYDDLISKNVIWVLSRIKFEIIEYPGIGDKITIETWPKGREKIIATRDMVFHRDGENICMGRSLWVLADLTTFRPQKLHVMLDSDMPLNSEMNAVEDSPEKFKMGFEMQPVMERTARYSEIDINQHLNNARYVDWVTDCFENEKYMKSSIRAIQINFLAQILPGQTVLLKKGVNGSEEDKIYIEGVDPENGRKFFEACVQWSVETS